MKTSESTTVSADSTLDRSIDELKSLIRDAEKALSKGGDLTEDKLDELRERLRSALDQGSNLYRRARDTVRERGAQADEVVRGHPYESIGIALGVGVLLGFLISRR